MKITEESVLQIYDLAREVYEEHLSRKEAVELAVKNQIMGKGSAQDYIQNYRYIMDGFVYKRTMNLKGTRIYLEKIYSDFGIQKLRQALEVVAAHVAYYNALGYGKQVQTQALVDELLEKYQIDSQGISYPDDIGNEVLIEGAKKQITINAYERNPKARTQCIEHYGSRCYVCGFDFHENYGDLGTGYIHVHHEVDLAHIGETYTVDPVKDLKPVCPNCHAMLHKTKPAMPVDKLKAMWLNRNRT
ncbi:HNH endonuclease [Vibrio campbellii]|uniref:HNH endonuclease n=1 Tax=Vibrio campbellii TaxID=680 RepID=UPI000A3EAFB3|nr:HNH endonuclease [Vibrio campbellii]